MVGFVVGGFCYGVSRCCVGGVGGGGWGYLWERLHRCIGGSWGRDNQAAWASHASCQHLGTKLIPTLHDSDESNTELNN